MENRIMEVSAVFSDLAPHSSQSCVFPPAPFLMDLWKSIVDIVDLSKLLASFLSPFGCQVGGMVFAGGSAVLAVCEPSKTTLDCQL